jgi:DNA-directed RNA polymerase specialized sigma24 family protein
VIDWVHLQCRAWSGAMRRVVYGSRGHPPRPTLDRLRELGFTSAPRWYCDERNPTEIDATSMLTLRAIRALGRVHRDILFAHYLLDGTAIDKARVLGISRRAYYARLARASIALADELRGRS